MHVNVTSKLQQTTRVLTLLLAVMIIAGCGYQLQKPLKIDASLQPVYISEETALGIAIKRELLQAGITTTSNVSKASSVMALVDAKRKNRSLTLAGDGRVAEYLASATATLVWQDSQQKLLSSTPLHAEAIRLARPDTPLVQHAESNQIRQELANELARQAIASLYRSMSTVQRTGN